MSTPAAAALSEAGAGSAPAPANGTGQSPGGSAGNAGIQPAANQNAFWNSWNLPDQKETKDWVANKNYDSPFTLAKTARELEREAATLRQGKGYPTPVQNPDGTIKPPDENAVKAWNTLTGVPETPDKYDIPVPEGNPYPEFKTLMAQALHESHVPAAMASNLVKGYEKAVSKMEEMYRAKEDADSQAGLAQIKDAWGAQYQERMSLAQRGKSWLAQEAGGLSDIQLRIMESMMGTPKFLTAMYKIGAGNGEHSFAGGDGGNKFQGTASAAQARLDQITADRSAGKISNLQWRAMNEPDGEYTKLMETIAAGFAPPS